MDCSQPGSSTHGFFQASVLKWVVISYSRGSSQPRDRTHVSYVSFVGRRILNHCATWEVARNYVGLVFFTSGTWLYNEAQFKSLCLLCSSSSMWNVLKTWLFCPPPKEVPSCIFGWSWARWSIEMWLVSAGWLLWAGIVTHTMQVDAWWEDSRPGVPCPSCFRTQKFILEFYFLF